MLEIVILAAGSSSRLGKSKQLLEINDQALVVRVASVASKLASDLKLNKPSVVIGKDYKQVELLLAKLPVRTVFNPLWEKGMGFSIAAGAKSLESSHAMLIMTCDQILLTVDKLKLFIKYWTIEPQKITASYYNKIMGIPVIFPTKYVDELIVLKSDKGAREILNKNKTDVRLYDFPEAAQDLDTEEDEMVLRKILRKNSELY